MGNPVLENTTTTYDTLAALIPEPSNYPLIAMKAILEFLNAWIEPDPLAEAVTILQGEINQLASAVNALISRFNSLEIEVARVDNQQRLNRLSDLTRQLADLDNQISNAPTDADTRDQIVFDAAGIADVFLDDADIWNWTDLMTTTPRDSDGNPQQPVVTNLAPDFKAYPALSVYAHAIATWLTALDLDTNGGNFDQVQSKYGTQLDRHILQTGVRAGWNYLTDPPETLPEQIEKRLACHPIPHTTYAVNQQCIFAIECDNTMLRNLTVVQDNLTVTMNDPGPDVFCTASEDLANPAFEQAANDNGVDVLTLLQQMLQKVRSTGTLRDPFTGTFDPTPVTQPAWLYAVVPGGNLMWQKIVPAATPQGNSTVLGPQQVGNGWNEFKMVLPAGGNCLYGMLPNGTLKWYQHDGFNDGTKLWKGPNDVSVLGWDTFLQVVPASDGVIYAVQDDGTLLWYRNDGYQSGNDTNNWHGPIKLNLGWDRFRKVFSVGQGTLYGVEHDGTLIWNRHLGWQDGSSQWAQTNPVGSGWQNFRDIWGTTDGTIFAVKPDGTLLMYQHLGFADGSGNWVEPVTMGAGWKSYLLAFPLMPENAPTQPA